MEIKIVFKTRVTEKLYSWSKSNSNLHGGGRALPRQPTDYTVGVLHLRVEEHCKLGHPGSVLLLWRPKAAKRSKNIQNRPFSLGRQKVFTEHKHTLQRSVPSPGRSGPGSEELEPLWWDNRSDCQPLPGSPTADRDRLDRHAP